VPLAFCVIGGELIGEVGTIEYDFQILKLEDSFFEKYPDPPFKEILKKRKRAYNCLLFQSHYDYFICIPFRTEISHPYAYHFKKSKRSLKHRSGLDYTKIIIVDKSEYIGSQDAIVDKDEYNETVVQMGKIQREALQYVEEYIAHIKGENLLHPMEFERKYGYSTLRYFQKELGVTEEECS